MILSKLLKCIGDNDITIMVSNTDGTPLCCCRVCDVPFWITRKPILSVDIINDNLSVLVTGESDYD